MSIPLSFKSGSLLDTIFMALEDFTSYTEVDTNNRLTIISSRVAWAALGDDETAYLYKDKGANFFDGNFTHLLTMQIATGSDSSTWKGTWLLANVVDDLFQLESDAENLLTILLETSGGGNPYIRLYEQAAGGGYFSSQYTLSFDTPYYLKVVRDEAVGTNGTLYLYMYSDADRATLLDTLELTLNAKNDFRYIYAINSRNDGSAQEQTGFVENLEIGEIKGSPIMAQRMYRHIERMER